MEARVESVRDALVRAAAPDASDAETRPKTIPKTRNENEPKAEPAADLVRSSPAPLAARRPPPLRRTRVVAVVSDDEDESDESDESDDSDDAPSAEDGWMRARGMGRYARSHHHRPRAFPSPPPAPRGVLRVAPPWEADGASEAFEAFEASFEEDDPVSSDASEGGSGGSGGSSSASPAGHGSASPSGARARGLVVGGRTKKTLRTKKKASQSGLRGSGSVEKEKKAEKSLSKKDEDVDAVVAEIEAEEAERARRRDARAKAEARGGGDERRRSVSLLARAEGAVGKKAEEKKKAGAEERKAGTEERKAGAEEKAGAFVPLERVPVSPPVRGTLDRIFA